MDSRLTPRVSGRRREATFVRTVPTRPPSDAKTARSGRGRERRRTASTKSRNEESSDGRFMRRARCVVTFTSCRLRPSPSGSHPLTTPMGARAEWPPAPLSPLLFPVPNPCRLGSEPEGSLPTLHLACRQLPARFGACAARGRGQTAGGTPLPSAYRTVIAGKRTLRRSRLFDQRGFDATDSFPRLCGREELFFDSLMRSSRR